MLYLTLDTHNSCYWKCHCTPLVLTPSDMVKRFRMELNKKVSIFKSKLDGSCSFNMKQALVSHFSPYNCRIPVITNDSRHGKCKTHIPFEKNAGRVRIRLMDLIRN